VAIARALVLRPKVLLLDEAFSALDLSVRADVLNLLADLRATFGITYLFVSHDLSVMRSLTDEIAVMYLGRIVESGTSDEVFGHPQHPYTLALLAAVPVPDPVEARARRRIILTGDPPEPARESQGCVFRERCWKVQPICSEVTPALERRGRRGGAAACHFPEPSSLPRADIR
jgi:oligopeptide/dipeptide ABC transporter ATP-binding protein